MKERIKQYKGFTLVELVMVMVIVGLLAAIIIPNFTSQRDDAAISSTKANLESLRTAIALYYAQEGMLPGVALAELVSGAVSGTRYIRAIPEETITPATTVVTTNNGAGGWHWDTTPGSWDVHPNLTGSDANGQAYSAY